MGGRVVKIGKNTYTMGGHIMHTFAYDGGKGVKFLSFRCVRTN